MRFIGALLITYFVSRGLRRLGLTHPPAGKLIAAHVLSLLLIGLAVLFLRAPADAFRPEQLTIYAFAQAAWLIMDAIRARVALWKPPAPVTEPSPRRREEQPR